MISYTFHRTYNEARRNHAIRSADRTRLCSKVCSIMSTSEKEIPCKRDSTYRKSFLEFSHVIWYEHYNTEKEKERKGKVCSISRQAGYTENELKRKCLLKGKISISMRITSSSIYSFGMSARDVLKATVAIKFSF